jgi:hypothetical protein
MIHSFLGLLTHAASVDHDNMPFPKVVLAEYLTERRDPHKESSSRRSLSTPRSKETATSTS